MLVFFYFNFILFYFILFIYLFIYLFIDGTMFNSIKIISCCANLACFSLSLIIALENLLKSLVVIYLSLFGIPFSIFLIFASSSSGFSTKSLLSVAWIALTLSTYLLYTVFFTTFFTILLSLLKSKGVVCNLPIYLFAFHLDDRLFWFVSKTPFLKKNK